MLRPAVGTALTVDLFEERGDVLVVEWKSSAEHHV